METVTGQPVFQKGHSCRALLWHDGGNTLCYAIVPPGRKLGLRVGFRPDSNRVSLRIGPSAGWRADFEVLPIRIRPKSGPEARFLARKHYCAT